MNYVLKLLFVNFILVFHSNCSLVYDSYLNIYKENLVPPHKWSEISNSTWKEFFISENVTNLIKSLPIYIDEDKELDLLVLDSETRLYWVSNIRGTSKEVKHQFISGSKLHDFVVSSSGNKFNKGDYILGINSKRDKILKFTSKDNLLNTTKTWEESDFLDLNSQPEISSLVENSQIRTIHLSQYESKRQLLLVDLRNYLDDTTTLLKIIVKDEKIIDLSLIKFKAAVKILGGFDMNKDGLIDILYVDRNNNLNVMVNDDPYYWHVFIATLNTVNVNGIPRVFISDSDRDGYPDIVTADMTSNTIGILFNNGVDYWEGVRKFFSDSNNKDKVLRSKQWTFVPLIEYSEEELEGGLVDFDVFPTSSKRRLNFEIFAIYERHLYWFVEKDLAVPEHFDWGSHQTLQNYMYCMTKCDIVIEDGDVKDYRFILDIDINSDGYPEFIIYSGRNTSLYWIKKYVVYLSGFGWNSNFWIYLIIYMYIISSFIGLYEFYRLKKLNDQMTLEKMASSSIKSYKSDNKLLPEA